MIKIYPFRKNHLLQILRNWEESTGPADGTLGHYFRMNKAIGAKDRRWISETFYGLVRWMGLVDHFSARPLTSENRLEAYLNLDPSCHLEDPSIPAHVRLSFPKHFYSHLVSPP